MDYHLRFSYFNFDSKLIYWAFKMQSYEWYLGRCWGRYSSCTYFRYKEIENPANHGSNRQRTLFLVGLTTLIHRLRGHLHQKPLLSTMTREVFCFLSHRQPVDYWGFMLLLIKKAVEYSKKM